LVGEGARLCARVLGRPKDENVLEVLEKITTLTGRGGGASSTLGRETGHALGPSQWVTKEGVSAGKKPGGEAEATCI